MRLVSTITERGVICDWRGCMQVADNHVRVDIPRGHSFTSLMWVRCGGHTPEPTSDARLS